MERTDQTFDVEIGRVQLLRRKHTRLRRSSHQAGIGGPLRRHNDKAISIDHVNPAHRFGEFDAPLSMWLSRTGLHDITAAELRNGE